jgi:hypothetical protein
MKLLPFVLVFLVLCISSTAFAQTGSPTFGPRLGVAFSEFSYDVSILTIVRL